MSIKYYHLAKDEELPDEFCAIRDVGGEPSEYTFYAPEAENAKLRELCKRVLRNCYDAYEQVLGWDDDWVILCDEARKLGIEVTE